MNTYPEMNREIVKLLKASGENYELYAAARIEELEAECETLSQAFAAAKAYIDSSACDPDTTAEMWKAYEAYQSALKRVKAPNAEVSDRRAHGNETTTGANGGSLH